MHATITGNRQFLPSYYRMRLTIPGFPPAFTPGQFAMVRPVAVGDPLLGRAFSILRSRPAAKGAEIAIVYRALGRATTLMATLGRGNAMHVLGPLGKGFRPAPGSAVLVGGGVGIPPLIALAERLASRAGARPGGKTRRSPAPLVLVGGRSRHDVLGVLEFRRAGCRVRVATDDGSLGHHGLVTDLLAPILDVSRNGGPKPRLYACGPEGMLHAVRRLALAADVPCQLCLEENMACGFGGCMGCAIPVHGEGMEAYRLCCKDGPVFEARELRW
jgi:dihydroorotate dehydrogenase electron transfer subunit